MKTLLTRLGVALVALLSLMMVAVPAAHAETPYDDGDYNWTPSSCDSILYWQYADITDTGTGYVWSGANYWTDYGIYGHDTHVSYGPIRDYYASQNWECGWLGRTESNVYQASFYSSTGPVFEQDFLYGYVLFYSNNLCRCYAGGGSFYASGY